MKLIRSFLASTAAIALVMGGAACSRSRDASTPSSSVQTPAPAAERVNPGSGYFGAAPENVNRSTPPTGMGGGPSSKDTSGGSSMGIDQSGSGTSGTGSSGAGMDMSGSGSTDMGTGIGGGPTEGGSTDDASCAPGSKDMKKKDKSKSGNGNGSTGNEKGSGSTGGTVK